VALDARDELIARQAAIIAEQAATIVELRQQVADALARIAGLE
jgi:hypothetical protein